MNVSAIIVTRGDVDLEPIQESLPSEWEMLIWNNGTRMCHRSPGSTFSASDLSVYGRYAAIEYASHDLIYVQDDDVIVSDPQAIVDEWLSWNQHRHDRDGPIRPVDAVEHVVCNMPQEFRHDGYTDSCLVGFGACFHRDAPRKAFQRWADAMWDLRSPEIDDEPIHYYWNVADEVDSHPGDGGWFHRTCDVVFTTLTPRVLVDVPKTNLPWAEDYSRMYRQPNHTTERMQMLALARQVRDAG